MRLGTIYIIKNDINNLVYIGQTTESLSERFRHHKLQMSDKERKSFKLYNAMNTLGIEHFYIEAIESDIPKERLDEKEIFYIKKFNSFINGYNGTKGGKGRLINTPEEEQDIKNLYLEGNSCEEISSIYSVSYTTIQRVLKRLNVKLRDNGNKYTGINTKKFLSMWNDENITLKQMAEVFNVSTKTLKRYADRLNLGRKAMIFSHPYK